MRELKEWRDQFNGFMDNLSELLLSPDNCAQADSCNNSLSADQTYPELLTSCRAQAGA
jgi:hypothetical protein